MTYNLQGIIRKTSGNIMTQFEKLGYSSQNIANMYTTGYKEVRFDDFMDENGQTGGVGRTNHKDGSFMMTQNPLDIGIQGAGYIPVTTKSGEIRYTRDGSFTVDKDGMLITKTGDLIGNGIKTDATDVKTEIRKNGDVYGYKDLKEEPTYLGTIPLVSFNNPEGLKEVGGNKFEATEKSGQATLIENHNFISQYGIELSNVDVFATVNQIMRTNASILASTTLIQAVNDMYDKAINITS